MASNDGNFGAYLTLTGEREFRQSPPPAWSSLVCNGCTLASPSLLDLVGVHSAKSKACRDAHKTSKVHN